MCKLSMFFDWMACSAAAIMHPEGAQFLAAYATDPLCRGFLIFLDVTGVSLLIISLFLEFALISFYIIFVIQSLQQIRWVCKSSNFICVLLT